MIAEALAVSALLQVADTVTTVGIIRLGGVELNPLIRRLMGWVGVTGAMVLKAIFILVILAICYWTGFFNPAPWAILALAGMSAAVVANNLAILFHLKSRRQPGRNAPPPAQRPAPRWGRCKRFVRWLAAGDLPLCRLRVSNAAAHLRNEQVEIYRRRRSAQMLGKP